MIVPIKPDADGHRFLVFNADRTRLLGKHRKYSEALAQLRAIEASKSRQKGK